MDREAFEEVRKFVERLRKCLRIEKAIFFGSRVRDDWLEGSDVDLILVSPDFEGVFFTDRMVQVRACWESKYGLEVFCYTPEEFQRKARQISIVRKALEEGVVIE